MRQDGNDANSSSDKNNNNSGSWRHFLWSWQDEGGAGVHLSFLAWGPCTEKQVLFVRGRGQELPEGTGRWRLRWDNFQRQKPR